VENPGRRERRQNTKDRNGGRLKGPFENEKGKERKRYQLIIHRCINRNDLILNFCLVMGEAMVEEEKHGGRERGRRRNGVCVRVHPGSVF